MTLSSIRVCNVALTANPQVLVTLGQASGLAVISMIFRCGRVFNISYQLLGSYPYKIYQSLHMGWTLGIEHLG